jgi:hypothetical protein
MVLVLPDVSATLGPDWAAKLNAALELVDLHDHSSDKGVPVTPSGLSINADLPFGGNRAKGLKMVVLAAQASALATADDRGSVQNIGGNLWWVNDAGAAVQLTSGSAVISAGSGAMAASAPGAYPYTVVAGDAQKVLLVDTSSARTLNLPAATTAMYVVVKDAAGSAQANPITVAPNGTDLIDGANAAVSLATAYGAWGFISDGVSKWYLV